MKQKVLGKVLILLLVWPIITSVITALAKSTPKSTLKIQQGRTRTTLSFGMPCGEFWQVHIYNYTTGNVFISVDFNLCRIIDFYLLVLLLFSKSTCLHLKTCMHNIFNIFTMCFRTSCEYRILHDDTWSYKVFPRLTFRCIEGQVAKYQCWNNGGKQWFKL